MIEQKTLNSYVVRLGGLFTIDAEVVAESPERAAAIAWMPPDGEDRPGESVSYLWHETESCDEDGPHVVAVRSATLAERRVSMTAGHGWKDMIGWNARHPTVEECELVGREFSYAEAGGVVTEGDYVIETAPDPDAQAKLAEAFEAFGMCDAAYVIPAGVYLEE